MEENKKLKEITNLDNIYLAYLRVKNNIQNEEFFLEQEQLYFENNINKYKNNINDENNPIYQIHNILTNDVDIYEFQKFDFITKIKKIESNKKRYSISYRPLVRYRFFDLVIMQSVFNIVIEDLKNFLPPENFGVQLDGKNSPNLYKNWTSQYKTFRKKQEENLSNESLYEYSYEYDLTQFYPSIQQENLLNQLRKALDLEQDDICYKWLRKIITYYNKENITEETQTIFNKYLNNEGVNESNDLGLPQGPIFSSFLAVFYTRDLFENFKTCVMEEYKSINYEHFAYMDDGRIYLSEKIEKKKLDEYLSDCLDKLNNSKINDKKIEINDDKTCLIAVDDESITNKIHYLTSKASLINASINPKYDVPIDVIESVDTIHKNIKSSMEKISEQLEKAMDKNDSSRAQTLKDEQNKLKKEFVTYTKRKCSFLTRKISSSKEFYNLVETIFNVDFYKNGNNNSENGIFVQDICTFNYFYNLYNLANNADIPQKKLFLKEKVSTYLKTYEENIIGDTNKEMMMYYYISTIKALYSAEYSQYFYEFIQEILKKLPDNRLLLKFYYSYSNDSWLLGNIDQGKELLPENENSDNELNAIKFYLQFPIEYKREFDFAIDNSDALIVTEDESVEKISIEELKSVMLYDKLDEQKDIYNYEIKIISPDSQLVVKKVGDDKAIKKLNFESITERASIKFLKSIILYWQNEYNYNEYIKYSYLLFDNYYIYNDDCICIYDNVSRAYKDYKMSKIKTNYQSYLKDFFMNAFRCSDSIIVNDKGRALKFWEYRILSFLHNKSFDIKEFFKMILPLLDNYDYFNHDVDINYERIRSIINDHLKKISDKDVIIELHYYLQCIWKNGAKDLPYFTLHNQEHSIELIQNYMKLNQVMMSKFSLSPDEKYILFSACYLHDIGMLKGATDKEIYDLKNPSIVNYYKKISNFNLKKDPLKIETILHMGYQIHDITESLFENIVRGIHHKRSFDDIQNDETLPLSDLEKQYVARVSLNHNNDASEVYGKKCEELFRNHNINIRLISIWLRLLDLTDITKYRVTQEVFSRYFDRMGIVSRFHWIKHLCVDDIQFKVSQEKSSKNEGKTIVTIKILMNYMPPKEKLNKVCNCGSRCCYKYECDEEEKIYKRSKINSGIKGKYCDLRCAFINENNWFENEVDYINTYSELYYDKNIEVCLEYVLNKQTQRDDFKISVLENNGRREVAASECIKDYFDAKMKG